MSRKRRIGPRLVNPDLKYNSQTLSKFINCLMLDGKKSIAQKIVYEALEKTAKEVNEQPIEAFNTVIKNAMPLMEVKSRRVGGSTYQVPIEVKKYRAITLAIRWIVANCREKKGASMVDKLSSEFIDIYNKTGKTIKKREDTHKMAEANKAFAHFRW